MTSAVAQPHPALRLLYALCALALSAGWLVAAALPAQGAQEWSVQSPAPGAVVSGSFDITASVTTFQEQSLSAVRARLRRGDQTVGEVRNLQHTGESHDATLPGQTRSVWQGSATTNGLANGTYVIEVSVVNNLYPEGSPWRGHEMTVDVAPTARLEMARVADADARQVELRWARSNAPDHVAYVVQRAHGGGAFGDVHTVAAADASGHIDTVPEFGEYRYRMKVVRKAADGSDREAISEPRIVTVSPRASGRPETGEEPEGRTPDDGEAGPSTGGGAGPTAPRLSGRSRPPSSTSGRSQRPNVAPPPNPNATFEERLDYGELPDWVGEDAQDPQVADAAREDGGTLTVFGGQEMNAVQVLKPVAGGLVLTLFGLHIVRFLRESP